MKIKTIFIFSQLPSTMDVCAHRILSNPLVAIAPAEHPLAKEINISFERFAQEPLIMREPGSGTRQALEELFHKHQTEPKVRLELGSNEAIKQAILGGLGVSVLSQHTLTLEKDTGLFAQLDVQDLPIQRNWYAVYPAGKQPSVVARTFLEYLEADHQLTINNS